MPILLLLTDDQRVCDYLDPRFLGSLGWPPPVLVVHYSGARYVSIDGLPEALIISVRCITCFDPRIIYSTVGNSVAYLYFNSLSAKWMVADEYSESTAIGEHLLQLFVHLKRCYLRESVPWCLLYLEATVMCIGCFDIGYDDRQHHESPAM